MKRIIISLCIFLGLISINTFSAEENEIGITDGQIVIIDLVLNSLVNIYGTNQLIVESYSNGGIAQKEALTAMQRNKDFLKVITGYAMDIKRQSARGDKKTTIFINKLADVCTALDLHLAAMVEFIEKNDKTSVNQLEKSREKAEILIEELIKSDLTD